MKINDITINESTTAGAIATVAAPMSTQKRNDVGKGVYGNEKPGKLLKGKKTSARFINSIHESFTSKQQVIDHFVKQGKTAAQGASAWERGWRGPKVKASNVPVANKPRTDWMSKWEQEQEDKITEAQLEEEDLILVPGQGHRLKTGFHAFDPDKSEHEGETLKNSLRTIARNAKELHRRLEDHDQFPEWVSEKIGQIKGMMTAVTEYLISDQESDKNITDTMDQDYDLDEEGKGLWANIHAKRERIKHGSGERMRKPGSKGAPSNQDFKNAASESVESVSTPEEFKKGQTVYLKNRTKPNSPTSGKVISVGQNFVIIDSYPGGQYKARRDNLTLDKKKGFLYVNYGNGEQQ